MVVKKLMVYYLLVILTIALGYQNQYGPEYGKKWILFNDEHNVTHRVDLSPISTTRDSRVDEVRTIVFRLYTRNNRDGEQLTLPAKNHTVKSEFYKSTKNLKVITHGWLASTEGWTSQMVDAFLEKGDYNVITVDWSEIASTIMYPLAASSTKHVGQQTAKMLDAIAKAYKQNGSNMHLIGHSLGAHVMGFASSSSYQKISRITGLDPARPGFEHPLVDPENRLDITDADFVDIIHTCAGILGYLDSRGDADFFPNSGLPPQPGCLGIQEIIESCSHGRSIQLFTESIHTKTPFYAYPCESWDKFQHGECKDNPVIMGEPASKDHKGNFYLYTNSEPTFSKGLNGTLSDERLMSEDGTGNVTKPME